VKRSRAILRKSGISEAMALSHTRPMMNGSRTALFNANGVWNHNERVTNDTVIGVDVDNKTGLEKETKNGIISYSKTGTHIVPSRGGEI